MVLHRDGDSSFVFTTAHFHFLVAGNTSNTNQRRFSPQNCLYVKIPSRSANTSDMVYRSHDKQKPEVYQLWLDTFYCSSAGAVTVHKAEPQDRITDVLN